MTRWNEYILFCWRRKHCLRTLLPRISKSFALLEEVQVAHASNHHWLSFVETWLSKMLSRALQKLAFHLGTAHGQMSLSTLCALLSFPTSSQLSFPWLVLHFNFILVWFFYVIPARNKYQILQNMYVFSFFHFSHCVNFGTRLTISNIFWCAGYDL